MEALHLTLPIPPSNNNYKRHFCTRSSPSDIHRVSAMLTKRATAFKNEAGWAANKARAELTYRPIRVDILVFPAEPGKGISEVDLDNIPKVLFDALEGIVWGNDRQIMDVRLRRMPGGYPDPHIEVTIEEADDVYSTGEAPDKKPSDLELYRRGRK